MSYKCKSQNELFNLIAKLVHEKDLIICISGRSCSGKTTLSEEIQTYFSCLSPLVISQDYWYKDIANIQRDTEGYSDMESLSSFEVNEFKEDIDVLLKEKTVAIPEYKISTNERISKKNRVNYSSLIVIEGLHTVEILKDLDSKFNGNVLYLYLNTSFYKCKERRILRDTSTYMVRSDFVERFYTSVIEKHYEPYIEIQKNVIESKKEKGVLYSE